MCNDGLVCVFINQWYWQCQEAPKSSTSSTSTLSSSTTTQMTTASTTTSTTSTTTTTANINKVPIWGQCGGDGYSGISYFSR